MAVRHCHRRALGQLRASCSSARSRSARCAPIYISNWFYGALIIVIAMLHIVNSLAVPVTLGKSYSLFPGAQDAIVQWWYGHNAVGFLLTGGFFGMLYYFLPKQAEQPIWSYRLSIVAFWAFVYSYIWAGPHHLHYNAIPEWVQSLGVVMSVILLAPSWATMINGVMTVSNAWRKLRTDPALKFIVLALAFYGLATFEGPMMAIRGVNVMSHFTEWTIGHVHSGALGWNALITFGTFYFLVPRLAGRPLYSTSLANLHFWLALAGTMLYIVSMWAAGLSQSLLWLSLDELGEVQYSFVDVMRAMAAVLLAAPPRRPRVSDGRGAHGRQSVPHVRGRRAPWRLARRCRSRSPLPSSPGAPHELPRHSPGHRAQHRAPDLRHPRRRLDRRLGAGAAHHGRRFARRAGERGRALPAARAHRPRSLYPRVVLHVPFPTSAPAARRGAPLWAVLARRRVRLRPAVSVGLEAHGPRPSPRSAADTATIGTGFT